MSKLILHPTETSQWHALVMEAQVSRSLTLSEDLESYLVFLLMRFAAQPQMIAGILAKEFLQSHALAGTERQEKLRDLGDKCLLFSGLFPGQAKRRQVEISYFVNMGQFAYSSLSAIGQQSVSQLYAELCEGFVSLMDVLNAMRETSGNGDQLLPLDAYALWEETGSQAALTNITKGSKALPVLAKKIITEEH